MVEKITHEEFVKLLLQALNKCKVDYMLIGGIVAIYYGRSRGTQDCDIIVSLEESKIKDFCESLKENGFVIREYDVKMAFKEKSHFNAYLEGFYFFRADFSLKNSTELNEKSFERVTDKVIFGVRTRMESPEDLIVAKLIFGSPQDIDDAKAVLLKQKGLLDIKYLQRRAEEEGVRIQFEKLLKEAEE